MVKQGGGVAVIKRYTLRLLTTQQFERASTLICACEKIRNVNEGKFGSEKISIGLWVGGSTTPNRFSSINYDEGAYQKFKSVLEEEEPSNPFQLLKCPWCGTRILPEYKKDDISKYGVYATENSFKFFCPNRQCDFHKELPVKVVDEDMYINPPTFLISTIDKFARLAWSDDPKAFFSGGKNTKRIPPSLIIQDELHLISGPLGTIAGIYETAVDTIMKDMGTSPKIIAATATIRNADEQVRKLYARNVAVFPPQGMNSDNSWYSREIRNKPGRMYLSIIS